MKLAESGALAISENLIRPKAGLSLCLPRNGGARSKLTLLNLRAMFRVLMARQSRNFLV